MTNSVFSYFSNSAYTINAVPFYYSLYMGFKWHLMHRQNTNIEKIYVRASGASKLRNIWNLNCHFFQYFVGYLR